MTSVLGILKDSDSLALPPQWNAALEGLALRPGPHLKICEADRFAAAVRTTETSAFFQDDYCFVAADGFVNLKPDIANTQNSKGQLPALSAAQLIASVFRDSRALGFDKLEGRFSATVVDRSAGCVYLLNGLLGSGTLYCAHTSFGWCWSSETKFLLPLLDHTCVNRDALSYVFHYRWPQLGVTEIEGVRECLPAHWIRLSPNAAPEEHHYASFAFPVHDPREDRASVLTRTDTALNKYFADLRSRTSKIGVLLSGGVDSSLLAAKACEAGFKEVVAVTVRWSGHDSPEEEQSSRVAGRLNIPLRVIDVPDDFVSAYLPQFVWESQGVPRHYSALGLAKIFQETKDIGTFISGEGADCVFGPGEILHLRRIADKQKRLPRPIRSVLGALLPDTGQGPLRRLGDLCRSDINDYISQSNRIEYRIAPHELVTGIPKTPARDTLLENLFCPAGADLHEHFQYLQLYTMNRSHELVYRRFSTPYDIAVEIPFLGSLVMREGWNLPIHHKIDGSEFKPVLRELLCRYIPREWVYARKFGFPAPLRGWLDGPLSWWRDLLTDRRTIDRGLYRSDVIRRLRTDLDSDLIWTALTFEIFLRQYVDGDRVGIR